MQTKTAVKVISLYDLIAKNLLLIIATLHHIIILVFNHYSIKHLDYLIMQFPEVIKQFEAIQFNLYKCQQITLIVAFVMYFINDFNSQLTKNVVRVLVMYFSCICKIGYMVFQYYNFEGNWISVNRDRDRDFNFGIYYELILFSYVIRYSTLIMTLLIPLSLGPVYMLDMCCKSILIWTKEYKITYNEKTLISKLEDV